MMIEWPGGLNQGANLKVHIGPTTALGGNARSTNQRYTHTETLNDTQG